MKKRTHNMKFTNRDCKNIHSHFETTRQKQKRRQERWGFLKGISILVFVFCLISLVPSFVHTSAAAVSTAIVENPDKDVPLPRPTNAVIEAHVVEATVPVNTCDLSFNDVRWGSGIQTPPKWFSDWFVKYNVTDCTKERWMTQIPFYEDHWCGGDENNCKNIVGGFQDTSLFQYIPSTWYAAWNPYNNIDIHDPEAQFRATIIMYDQGRQHEWTTNIFTR